MGWLNIVSAACLAAGLAGAGACPALAQLAPFDPERDATEGAMWARIAGGADPVADAMVAVAARNFGLIHVGVMLAAGPPNGVVCHTPGNTPPLLLVGLAHSDAIG